MDKLDVLYTVNNKYIDIMLASILSLIENGKVNIRLHIITSDFTKEDYYKIVDFLNNLNIEFYFYDFNKFAIEKYHLPKWRNTEVANARLFFQSVMGYDLEKIENLLYLDADTLVVDSLSGLQDYNNNTINAVIESAQKSHFIKTNIYPYYNSGVLYFNISKWINNNMEDKIIHYLENRTDTLIFPDQDTINYSLHKYITQLPLNYNFLAIERFLNSYFRKLFFDTYPRNIKTKEIENAMLNPIILHSTSLFEIKPWDSNVHPDYELFTKYLNIVNPEFKSDELTIWQKFFAKNPTLLKVLIVGHSFIPKTIQPMARKLAVKVTKR